MRNIRLISVSGTPFAMGAEWGIKARRNIRAGVAFYKKHWRATTKCSWAQSVRILSPTISLTEKLLPLTFAELQGVGKGSGVPWQDLFVINSCEALERFRPRNKCTSIIARAGKNVLLAHNEDWTRADQQWLYAVHAHPKGEPSFLCATYGPWLQTYGLNSAGLAFAADSDHARDARIGIAQTFIGREIMRYRTIAAAKKCIIALPRADGHSYVLAASNGEGIIVETTAHKYKILRMYRKCHTSQYGTFCAQDILVHTNFLQSPALQSFMIGARLYSRFRYHRARELFAANVAQTIKSDVRFKDLSYRMLFRVLADHRNYPESICCHVAEAKHNPLENQTIASYVLNPLRRTMHLVRGNPCRGKVQTFSL